MSMQLHPSFYVKNSLQDEAPPYSLTDASAWLKMSADISSSFHFQYLSDLFISSV